ncbi:hypothetical protein Sste5346_001127 [Sporothrix stenoceras]|uniref:Uncharacterized protein n=1 Tax=Sporothrix stenoceras TaxID=5173 RepID=A0ABR3ZR66_9PEZI
MPSRNSFSIRKLFSSPRRLSLIADEAALPTDERFLHSNNSTKRRSDASTNSALSDESRGSSRGSTASDGTRTRSRHGSRGSSGSSSTTIFHPDSSISITTPQAERGLTDNVDHELSQEEIDRIKAVVAAAAAAAASSLRLRMDNEGSEAARTVRTIKTIQATTFDRILMSHETNASTSTTNTTNKKRSESTESAIIALAPPNLLSKALPPPPPPRVSSYFATRPSWKSKTEKSEKFEKSIKTITAPSKTTDTSIHPLYRDQNGEPDCKKDSGIALDQSQTSLVDNTEKETKKKVVTIAHIIDSDSDSDAGSCIDLLQALAIQPEEAGLLRRPTADSTSSVSNMMQPSSLLTVDSDSTANANLNTADGPGLRNVCTTPTFTQPRMAPTPSPSAVPSAVPSETNTPQRMMSPSPSLSPRPSFMGPTSRASGTFSAMPVSVSPSPSSPKKQGTRFLPLRLNKGLPDAALRIQRKRSKKARKRERQAASNMKGESFSDGKSQMDVNNNGSSNNSNSNNNNSNNNSGSSRWTLPDNVTELFNGRLFSRMEVTETLPFEKLQAIRESRALAQKQQEEAEEKRKAKQLLDEQDEKEKHEAQNQKQQRELVDAEQALIKELQRSQAQMLRPDAIDTSSTAPLETLLECEEEEIRVSPLDPEDAVVDADGNPIESNIISMPVSPPTDSYPPPTLPMPPHIATQMVWPGDEEHEEDEEVTPRETKPDSGNNSNNSNNTATKTKTLFLSVAREEPDGSTTPIEPFHMEDLPSRIGAAGVRVSILLPVEEEEAYFASSVAQHKERRRREQEERAREREEEDEADKKSEEEDATNIMPDPPKSPLDEVGPFPSPPTKNPMRFQSFIKKMGKNPNTVTPPPPLVEPPPTQSIPQVTVTDVDSQKRRHRPALAKASRKSLGKTPKSSFFLSSSSTSSSLIPHPRSSLSASSSTSPMAALAAAASATPHQRDEETYVYLSATPFSLVMPTYRHGPIRLNRSDLMDNQTDSRNSYDHKLRHHHHHPNIATVEETLDWTAFQMAILGGAGEFRSEVIDYGQISAAEQDEVDRLADWFLLLDIKPERLLTSAEEDTEWVRAVPPPPEASTTAAPPTLTHHTQRTAGSQWTSVSSSTVAGVGAPVPTDVRGLTHSRTTTSTSIATTASGYSSSCGSSNRDSGTPNNAPVISTDPGLTAQTVNQALPFQNSNSANSPYAMSRDNSAAPGLVSNTSSGTNVVGDDITPTQPRTLHSLPLNSMHSVQDVRASFASVASYESMPQSPMADLIMTHGADGKEYVAPMGYNLSHDLGDYLQWEKDNVYAMALEEPR